jgi:hypothetical protein
MRLVARFFRTAKAKIAEQVSPSRDTVRIPQRGVNLRIAPVGLAPFPLGPVDFIGLP